jgi:hypothetical protein
MVLVGLTTEEFELDDQKWSVEYEKVCHTCCDVMFVYLFH